MTEDEDKAPDSEEGIDFTDIEPVLDDLSYPITKEEFVEEHGDHTIERTSADPITVREVFEGTGEDTFEDEDEIRQAVLNMMPRGAVGRDRYSDRGGGDAIDTPGEGGQSESF